MVILTTILIIYASGSLIEMICDVVLVNLASRFVIRVTFYNSNKYIRTKIRTFINYLIRFLMLLSSPATAVFGNMKYNTGLINGRKKLSNKAKKYFIALDKTIQLGLDRPTANNGDVSIHMVLKMFKNERDKLWAKSLIGNTKDVASLTNTIFLIALIFVIFNMSGAGNQGVANGKIISINSQVKNYQEAQFKKLTKTYDNFFSDVPYDFYAFFDSERTLKNYSTSNEELDSFYDDPELAKVFWDSAAYESDQILSLLPDYEHIYDQNITPVLFSSTINSHFSIGSQQELFKSKYFLSAELILSLVLLTA